MSCKYPTQRFNISYNKSYNGQLYSAFGINWPKEFKLACGGFEFNKSGIAIILENWNIFTALAARGIGLIDTITYFINLPFMLLLYTVLTVWAIINWILLGIFIVCMDENTTFYKYMMFIGMWGLFYIPTLLKIIMLTLLTPFQIIVPELTCYVFRIQEW